jgi:broad specificity phosphatase PhoE
LERRLLLVRHGESEANRAGVLDGYPDAPLTALGRAQVVRLADWVRELELSNARLITSPLRRALDTAAAIGRAAELAAKVDHRLLAGEGRASLERGPAAAEVAEAIADGFGDGATTLVAVSHRFPLGAYLRRLCGPPTADRLMPNMGNGDVVEIIFRGGRPGEPRHIPLRDGPSVARL